MKNLEELPRLKDSVSYLYVEHTIIEKADNAIVLIQKEGKTPIPVASLTCLLLGPGTNITHAAIRVLCENGCMAIWCGEHMGRFYAAGIGETRSAKNLLLQAKACMDETRHMEVVRKMYTMRFPNIETNHMTLQQIRGMEGIRVRKAYELAAKVNGIHWKKRSYKTEDWDASDPINQALSEANALLYGVCHAAIVSMGFSPGLGFVHTGKQLSFVYDIADLYKAETTIPAAFEAVKRGGDLARETRVLCRRYFAAIDLLSRIPQDLNTLFRSEPEGQQNAESVGDLWDKDDETLRGGRNFAGEGDGE